MRAGFRLAPLLNINLPIEGLSGKTRQGHFFKNEFFREILFMEEILHFGRKIRTIASLFPNRHLEINYFPPIVVNEENNFVSHFCFSWTIIVKWTVWFSRRALQLFVDNSFLFSVRFCINNLRPYTIIHKSYNILFSKIVFQTTIIIYTCRSDVQACRILKSWNRFQTLSKWRHETVINIMVAKYANRYHMSW